MLPDNGRLSSEFRCVMSIVDILDAATQPAPFGGEFQKCKGKTQGGDTRIQVGERPPAAYLVVMRLEMAWYSDSEMAPFATTSWFSP